MSGDLACTYAALILADDGQEVTAEKIDTVVKAAGVSTEPYWSMLFGKFLATKSVDELIANVGAGMCTLRRFFSNRWSLATIVSPECMRREKGEQVAQLAQAVEANFSFEKRLRHFSVFFRVGSWARCWKKKDRT